MQPNESKRTTDLNGWLEVRDNPISKAGVFPYLGSEIGAPEPNRIYQVYRPAEELADPECIASFRLLPFIDEHVPLLGSEEKGGTPAERKGVQGMIGEQVYFDPPYLRGNLKIVSDAALRLISNGKIELSPGYRCRYEFTPGVFEGVAYDAVQRRIRGNHLALVDDGRTGPDIAVQDHCTTFTLTIDSAELIPMADEKPEDNGGGDDLAKIKELLGALKPLLEKQKEAQAMLAEYGLGVAAPAPAPAGGDEEPPAPAAPAADEEPPAPAEQPPAKDEEPNPMTADSKAILEAIKKLDGRIAKVESGQLTVDAMAVGIADRDQLAQRLSGFVGTFDHARMSTQAVAEYGIQQLGIPCSKGHERIALDAWLHGRTPEHKRPTVALDGKAPNLLETWEK